MKRKACNEILISPRIQITRSIRIQVSTILIVIAMSVSTVSAFGPPSGNLRQHDDLACDGDEIHLRCPGSDIINVRTAFYGRQDDMKCVADAVYMADTECSLPNASTLVSEKCNGKTVCEFLVGQTTFEDPCPGTKKYLQVSFECVPLIIACPGKLKGARRTTYKQTSQRTNGAWARDPYQETNRIYYMGYASLETRQLLEFASLTNMSGTSAKPLTFYQMNGRVDGTGFVVYDRNLYYNEEGTRKIVRFDLSKQDNAAEVILENANYHHTSPYSIDLATDIDLAVDENGLWAIYAAEYNDGNIVISRLDHHTLKIIKTWQTKYDKISALNAFIICGVLYAVNANDLKIDYMFNTTSNEGFKVSIPLPGLTNTVSSIDYNPKDQQLYVWDNAVAINYKLIFEPIIVVPPPVKVTTTKPTTTTTTSTTTTTTPKPTHVRPPIPPSQIPVNMCKGRKADGLQWADTKYGHTATQNCPGSTSGEAIWVCGGNRTHPTWVTEKPDFTPCISHWIKDIENELGVGLSSAAVLSMKFRNELEEKIAEKPQSLNSWDITTSVQLLAAFFNQGTKEELQNAAKLMDSIHESASLLLRPDVAYAWKALDPSMQNKMAGELISTLEDTAFFLAYDISTGISPIENSDNEIENSWNFPAEQVTLGIRVEPIATKKTDGPYSYESIRWWTGQGDSVKVHTSAVVDALADLDPVLGDQYTHRGVASSLTSEGSNSTTRHLSIVLLSFRNIGDYLKDPNLSSSISNPINSRVVSVSAATIDKTTSGGKEENVGITNDVDVDVVVNKHHTLDLSKSITLTMKHIKPGLKHNVCVYWKYIDSVRSGKWSRSGCRRVDGNSTHSTCECDHMTSFAVLSSNTPFPPMGEDFPDPGDKTPVVKSTQFEDLPIVRTGLGISLFFLLIVAITLISVRSIQNDTNTTHKNLIFSLIFTEIVFMTGIDYTAIPALCGAVAALLHFGLLAAFTWAALEAFHLMISINDMDERRNRWPGYYIVGYGLPSVVVATSAAINHQGYGSLDVCWLDPDGPFKWSFIGPCCFIIVCCVVFLAGTMYKLHLYTINFTVEAPKNKDIRAGVARSCVLMFLLCALWSCGVLWLSNYQPRATAVLFCILLAGHGIASLVLYCILSPEVRSRYKKCFHCNKKNEPSRHPSRRPMIVAHNARHPSTTSTQPTTSLRTNASMQQYPGYHYTLGSQGCTEYRTTLVPESYTRNMSLSKAADAMAQRAASDLELTRITNVSSEPRYSINRGHSDGSAADLTNDTISPKPNTRIGIDSNGVVQHMQNHNGQYLPPPSGGHLMPNHHYEPPLPHFNTVSSGASGAYNHLHEDYPSGSHHHAHDHCMHQVMQPGSRNHYESLAAPCPDCSAADEGSKHVEGQRPPVMHYKHRYEDVQPIAVCVAQGRSDVQCASYPCCDNASPHYRIMSGSNGDLVNSDNRVNAPPMQGNGRSCRTMPGSKTVINHKNFNNQQSMTPSSNHSFPAHAQMGNGVGMPRHHSNIVMGTTALSSGNSTGNSSIAGQPPMRRPRNGSYSFNKTGRASDPLSTDQGYDTDSQPTQCKRCGGGHSETDPQCPMLNSTPPIKQQLIVRPIAKPAGEGILHPGSSGKRLLPPSPATSSSSSITKPSVERSNPSTRRSRKKGSTSDLSDCTSENDREVEMIYTSANGSTTSSPAAHGDSGAYDEDDDEEFASDSRTLQPHLLVDPPVAFRQQQEVFSNPNERPLQDDLPEDLIDVERGGRMSVAESVTSWCGQSGSNPRAMNASYGRHKSTKKSTNDPQVILANARKSRNQLQGSNSQLSNHSDSISNRDNTAHNGYTLRGSTEAGTKARVDLKAGSISMITNL